MKQKVAEMFGGLGYYDYLCSVKIQEGYEAAAPEEGCLFCVHAIGKNSNGGNRVGYRTTTPKAYLL